MNKVIVSLKKCDKNDTITLLKKANLLDIELNIDFSNLITIEAYLLSNDMVEGFIEFIYEFFDVLVLRRCNMQNGSNIIIPKNDAASSIKIIEKKRERLKIEPKTQENEIMKIIAPALEKLDKSKDLTQQVDEFLRLINMNTISPTVRQALICSTTTERLEFDSIVEKLRMKNPTLSTKLIGNILRDVFASWITKNHPDIKNKCAKMSMMSLLKAFSRAALTWQEG